MNKENERNKISWEQLQQDSRVYMPDNKFVKAYNKTMRYIINKTNLQTAMFYYVLRSHMNHDTGDCFPSLEVLALECGTTTRTIMRMIKDLSENKIISYNKGRHGKCNQYYFLLNEESVNKQPKKKSNFYSYSLNNFEVDDLLRDNDLDF